MDLKQLIANTEQRFISYKGMLEDVNRNRDIFPPEDEGVIKYKEMLRENKNSEQVYLKKMIEEKRNENEGLNPPWCYPYLQF